MVPPAKGSEEILEIEGHEVRITSPDKVFFPERGETKLDLVNHYLRIAEPVMRTMGDRPLLLQRFPNLDLDPQPGTDFTHARAAAHELKTLLDELGVVGYPKTTGNQWLHVYVRLEPRWDSYQVRSAAVAVARELERRRPDLLTAQWWKEDRGERVLVDFNQNAPHKTVFGAWCVRPRPGAQVSTPIRWDEIDAIHPDELTIGSLPGRIEAEGDPWAEINDNTQSLEPFLAMHERDRDNGLHDAPCRRSTPSSPMSRLGSLAAAPGSPDPSRPPGFSKLDDEGWCPDPSRPRRAPSPSGVRPGRPLRLRCGPNEF